MPRRVLAVAVFVLLAPPAAAQPAPPDEAAALAHTLRSLLLAHLPDPVLESARHWGGQKEFVVGLKWHRPGTLLPRADPIKRMRNDGHWQKVRVEAIDPAKTLALAVKDVRSPAPGTTTFEAYLGLDTRLAYDQQLWQAGVRLYGGSTRARCRAALKLACEATNRFEAKPGSVLPTAVFRVRVTNAELFYTDLVVEHTAGLDGEPAKKVGEAVHKLLREAKPNLERDLLAKANAAIVRAADTKEVRVEFDKLLAGKPPGVTRPK